MNKARKTANTDIRRSLTCATLATITTLGVFSLVANVMTPLVSGLRLPAGTASAQASRTDPSIEDRVCVQTAHAEGADRLPRPSIL
jgi:hypothetical protein